MGWLGILYIFLLLVVAGAFFYLIRRLAAAHLKGVTLVAIGLILLVLNPILNSLSSTAFLPDERFRGWRLLIGDPSEVVTQTAALVILLLGAYRVVRSLLPQSAEHYSSLVEHSLVGVYLIQDGVFKFVNPHLAEIFGYQRKDLIGKPALDLVAPESRTTVAENIHKRINGEKQVIHYEFTGLKKNGEKFDVEVHGSRTIYQGKPAVHGSLLDVTERKRAEEALRASESKYRQLVEQSSDAVFLADKDGNLRFVNSCGCEMLGYSLEELQRMNIKETYPPEETALAMERMKQPLLGKSLRFERKMRRKDGSYLPVEVSLKWIPEGLFQGIVRDITERKQAEEALMASEDRFRRLSENAQDIIYRYRLLPTRGFEYVSPAATVITGYTPEEHYADPDLDFKIVHPDDRCELERLVSGNGTLSQPVTLRWVRKDGKIISVEQRNVPIHDEAGRLVAIEGIARDMTEQRRAKEVLREREERFRVLIENSSDAIALLRADTSILYVSPSAINVLGYSPEELLGTSPFERIHSNDLERARALLPELLQSPGRKLTVQVRLRHKDGSWRCIEAILQNLLSNPNVQAIVANYRDITERMQAEKALSDSEKKYRDLVDNALVGVYRTNLNGDILYVNDALSKMFEFDSPAEMISRRVLARYKNPRDREVLIEDLKRTGKVSNFEIQVMTKTGKTKTIILSATLEGDVMSGMIRDITERKRAEEALSQSREWLNAIFDASRDGIVVEEDEKIVYANKSFASLYGYDSPEELIDEQVAVVQSDEYNQQMLEFGRKRLRGEPVPTLYEFKGKRKDGALIDLEASVSTFTIDAKEHVITAIRDITERKQAEDALRESEEKFRSLAEQSPNMIFINIKGRIVYANKKSEEIMGYQREELYSPKFDFLKLIAPESVESVKQNFGRHLQGEEIPPYEYTLLTKEGKRIVGIHTTKLIKYGEEHAILGIITDITERKQAEEALRLSDSILQKVGNLILVADSNGMVRYASPSARTILGYEPEELLGEGWWIHSRGNSVDREGEKDRVVRAARGEIAPDESPYERELKHRDGTSRWILWQDTKGPEGLLIGVGYDVTERKRLEQQLMQAQKMESLGTLAGGIAHDFNNILAIILGYASILEGEKVDPAKTSKSIGAINKSVQRGASLVRQLLTFARKTDALVESVRVNDTIGELANLLKDTFPKTIQVSLELDERLPPIIGDANQLHQALLNLSVNALDAMPRGGTLTLSTRTAVGIDLQNRFPDAREDQYIWISVADTGIGMDESTRSRIFEPFFTTKEKGRGTGLGLAVVYGIVTGHHGFIDVESQLGRGSTFHLYLPVQSHFIESSAGLAIGDTPEVTGGTETVLVVEDEQMLLDLLTNLLAGKGYKVLTATDGLEAAEVYRQHKQEIALVLMDMGIPKLGGWETYLKIRENNPKAKVIIASGFVEPNLKSEILKAGAKDFVQKPYVPKEVLRRVRRVIDQGEK